MTATCGARTWASPDDLITCTLPPHASDEHHSGKYADGGVYEWLDYHTKCQIPLGRTMHGVSPAEARELLGCVQRQLAALEPGAELAEAERRMNDAHERRMRLWAQSGTHAHRHRADALELAAEAAEKAWLVCVDEWADAKAKGGGA